MKSQSAFVQTVENLAVDAGGGILGEDWYSSSSKGYREQMAEGGTQSLLNRVNPVLSAEKPCHPTTDRLASSLVPKDFDPSSLPPSRSRPPSPISGLSVRDSSPGTGVLPASPAFLDAAGKAARSSAAAPTPRRPEPSETDAGKDGKAQTQTREVFGGDSDATGSGAMSVVDGSCLESVASNESSELDYSACPEEALPGASVASSLRRLDLTVRQTLGLCLGHRQMAVPLERAGLLLREDVSTLLASEGAAARAEASHGADGDWRAVCDVGARVREWVSDVVNGEDVGENTGETEDLGVSRERCAEPAQTPSYMESVVSDESSDLDYSACPEEARQDGSIENALERLDLQVRQALGLCLNSGQDRLQLEAIGAILRRDIARLLACRGVASGDDWSSVSDVGSRVRVWVCDVVNGEDGDNHSEKSAAVVDLMRSEYAEGDEDQCAEPTKTHSVTSVSSDDSLNLALPSPTDARTLRAGDCESVTMKSIQRIGDYRLGKTLGLGSFGKVKLAVHEQTGKKVAVRILSRAKIQMQQMGEKLKREIKILKMCIHPHILRLYEVIETPSDVFVVTEYSPGGELFDYIVEHGRLDEREARRFFQQIIAGVEYCHNHNVAHRDLKPENMMLDEHKNLKIADFGLSTFMRDGWFLKTSCGSPNYASPDVVSGKLYAGPEADIWSTGVILFALLCGTLPFDDESIPYLFRKIKGGIYIMPAYLSDSAKDLIGRMLMTDSLKRITIADIRAHPWFLQDLPRYLSVPMKVGQYLGQIDQAVLAEVAQLTGFPSDKISKALSKGRRSHYTVAYHLIKDAQENLDTSIVSQVEAVTVAVQQGGFSERLFPISPANPSSHVASGAGGGGPTHGYPGHSQPDEVPMSSTSAGMGALSSDSLSNMMIGPQLCNPVEARSRQLHHQHQQGANRFMPTRRWNVGIALSLHDPAEAMLEVYRTLHRLQWGWKTPRNQPFQVRVLVNQPGMVRPVRLSLQLFRTNLAAATGFTLDLHLLDGDELPYLAIANQLFREFDSVEGR